MQTCNECHIEVRTKEPVCPVCGSALEASQKPVEFLAKNSYPDLHSRTAAFGLVFRILKAVTVFACLFSVLANAMLTPSLWWSLLVLAASAYGWILMPAWIRRRANVVRVLLFQILLTGLAVVLVDFVTGYRAWSMDYVVPSLLIAGIATSGLIIAFNFRQWSQYVFYQVSLCAAGLLPLLFYFLNLAHNLPLVLISAGLGLAGLVLTVFLADKSIKNEFVKRFHV